MRFVVDLYRYILLTLVGLVIIGLLLLTFAAFDPNGPFQGEYATPVMLGAFTMALFLVLSVGGLAIIISIHDRHAEIADSISELVDALRPDDDLDETP
ncbi:hypothetical protein [Sphingomonas turrisvirgatae]|uniref:Uncharacterized protein n=1 Tax=Sphingomonas turrisvirgatae TaxID=1888892 RepID=A0A1E3LTP4_9SPHN|nr:hypothetical protein [Sphingomonas turrisvirgatae]ODP37084.1 hypothetical protein BFL28_18970 [Sphingomonas turrisvirgatae]